MQSAGFRNIETSSTHLNNELNFLHFLFTRNNFNILFGSCIRDAVA